MLAFADGLGCIACVCLTLRTTLITAPQRRLVISDSGKAAPVSLSPKAPILRGQLNALSLGNSGRVLFSGVIDGESVLLYCKGNSAHCVCYSSTYSTLPPCKKNAHARAHELYLSAIVVAGCHEGMQGVSKGGFGEKRAGRRHCGNVL